MLCFVDCFLVGSVVVVVDFLGFGLDFVVDSLLACIDSFDSLAVHCFDNRFDILVDLVDLVDCLGIDCCSFVCVGNLGFGRSFVGDTADWGIVGLGFGIGLAGVVVVVGSKPSVVVVSVVLGTRNIGGTVGR